MTVSETLSVQAVKHYATEQILARSQEASQLANQMMARIAEQLKPGMKESVARRTAMHVFEAAGVTTLWHRPYIYFGKNTVLTFRDKPQTDETLQESDIITIDIGPVPLEVDGLQFEGDVGCTLVLGDNPLYIDLKNQCERINTLSRAFWKEQRPTGIALYNYIHQLAKEAGYVFQLEPAGHLIGTFPHTGWKAGLNTYPEPVEPGIWILEIQIRHPELSYGAFCEDLLI
ncbi:MAG: aminopeptidase P family protein [Cyanobacteria bacterium]|nr:aminopeptidase P family protein [Cyanobacteriota bacterium]